MQPDDTRTADVRAWLAKTRQDLRRVEILLAATPADVEGALFHCQQYPLPWSGEIMLA
jgi:hypothetical protein